MSITSLLSIAIGAILVNNFILSQFLGICPFMGVSRKMDTALGMGAAVTFVMGVASAVTYAVNLLLVKLGLGYMQTVAYILVIAALVQFIEMFLQKAMPALYSALGIYLPLLPPTVPCWVWRCKIPRTATISLKAWSTASPVVWALRWRFSCLPRSGSGWTAAATAPSALRASLWR